MSKNINWAGRALLVAFCAWLGVLLAGAIVWRLSGQDQRDREEEAIAELEAEGGIVGGKHEFGSFGGRLQVWHVSLPKRPTPRTMESIKVFPHLKSVTIKGEQLSDDEEARLAKELGVRVDSFVPVRTD